MAHKTITGILAACVVVLAAVLWLFWQVGGPASVDLEEPQPDAEVVRIVIAPPAELAAAESDGLLARFGRFLGVRRAGTIKPAVGSTFTVQASAYASSPYQTDSSPCITAAGTRVRPGTAASNFLPLGTILEINGKQYMVEDRMNARYKGYYLDIWFTSTSDALVFGRRQLQIKVVGYGSPGQQIVHHKPTPAPTPPPKKQVDAAEAAEEGADAEVLRLAFWERVRVGAQVVNDAVTDLLDARVGKDVNRYDVDCLAGQQ